MQREAAHEISTGDGEKHEQHWSPWSLQSNPLSCFLLNVLQCFQDSLNGYPVTCDLRSLNKKASKQIEQKFQIVNNSVQNCPFKK